MRTKIATRSLTFGRVATIAVLHSGCVLDWSKEAVDAGVHESVDSSETEGGVEEDLANFPLTDATTPVPEAASEGDTEQSMHVADAATSNSAPVDAGVLDGNPQDEGGDSGSGLDAAMSATDAGVDSGLDSAVPTADASIQAGGDAATGDDFKCPPGFTCSIQSAVIFEGKPLYICGMEGWLSPPSCAVDADCHAVGLLKATCSTFPLQGAACAQVCYP